MAGFDAVGIAAVDSRLTDALLGRLDEWLGASITQRCTGCRTIRAVARIPDRCCRAVDRSSVSE